MVTSGSVLHRALRENCVRISTIPSVTPRGLMEDPLLSGTILGAGNTVENKTDQPSTLLELLHSEKLKYAGKWESGLCASSLQQPNM